MFSMVTGLLLGGVSLARVAAVGAIALPLAFGAGYFKGYAAADKSSAIEALQAEISARNIADGLRAAAERDATEAAQREADIAAANTKTERTLEHAIASAPIVEHCATGEFLDSLRRLK